MEPAHTGDVAARYARFASHEARAHSEVYQRWAEGLAADPQACALVAGLPPGKRQPNIVFACARLLGAEPGPYQNLRDVLLQRFDELAALAATRSTQTNEAARLGVLLPVFAHLSRSHGGAPLALVELGASAGLCLWPDRWAYRYIDRNGNTLAGLAPAADHAGEPIGTLEVVVKEPLRRGGVGLPTVVPTVAHRSGIDLNPLQAGDPEDAAWLRTLVWPGQQQRLHRLDAALEQAARHPSPVTVGDLRTPEVLDAQLAAVPPGAVPVVFHTAVLAYLDDADRARAEQALLERVREGQCHWVTNEGQAVLASLGARVAADAEFTASLRRGSFIVALDGEPLYQADGHAGWILG